MFSILIFRHEFIGNVHCLIGLTYYGKFSNYNIHSQYTNMLYTHLYICNVHCLIRLTYYGKFSNYNIHSQYTNMLYTHLYICLQSCITLVSCLLHVMTDITHQCCVNYFSITITFTFSMHF